MINFSSLYPTGWSISSISNLVTPGGVFIDGDWVESKDQDPSGKIRLLQLADIGDGKFLNKSNRWINDDAFLRLRCTEIIEGDILIARMPDPLGRACLMPPLPDKAVTVVDVAILRCSKFYFYNQWLMHWINSPNFRRIIESHASGTTRKRIARGRLGELEIPIPPVAEQRRIADKLDTTLARVDALNDRLARITPLLQRFRQSVLAAATSGRLTADWRDSNHLPFAWNEATLGEIANVQGGLTKDSKKQLASDEELPYLRVANVQRGYIDLDEIKNIRVPSKKIDSLLLEYGDILFNEGGDLDKLGRGWIWEGQIERCTFQNHVFRARLYDLSNQPKYISWWGNYRGLQYFIQSGKQTTNLASINKTMLSGLPISLPPPDEQTEIVRRVEILFAFADRLQARLQSAQTAAERLTPALLAKAFRGELVPQDPNDEPATELLRRLREARAAQAPAKPQRGRKAATAKVAP